MIRASPGRGAPRAAVLRPGSVAAALVLLLWTAPVAGQQQASRASREERSGFWLTGGIGGGARDDGKGGVAAYLRAGGTVSPHVLLGADLGLWDHGAGRYGNSGTGDLYGTFDLLLYPSAAAGGFLKLGAGLFVGGRGSGEGLDAAGMAGTVGGGWDVRLPFGGLDVTPGLDVLLLRDADASGSEALHAVYLFTVGVGFH